MRERAFLKNAYGMVSPIVIKLVTFAFLSIPSLHRAHPGKLAEILWKAIEWDERVAERASKKEKIMYLTPSLFRAPTIIVCILPGDYYYLRVRGPRETRWRNTEKMNRNGYVS